MRIKMCIEGAKTTDEHRQAQKPSISIPGLRTARLAASISEAFWRVQWRSIDALSMENDRRGSHETYRLRSSVTRCELCVKARQKLSHRGNATEADGASKRHLRLTVDESLLSTSRICFSSLFQSLTTSAMVAGRGTKVFGFSIGVLACQWGDVCAGRVMADVTRSVGI